MKNMILRLTAVILTVMTLCVIFTPVKSYASADAGVVAVEETNENDVTSAKGYAAAICIGLAAMAGAIGMAIAIKGSADGIARQPEAEGPIRTTMMLGLVFIETAIIYALIVAILIIFVL